MRKKKRDDPGLNAAVDLAGSTKASKEKAFIGTPSLAQLDKISSTVIEGWLESWQFLRAFDQAYIDFYTAELAARKLEGKS